MNKLVELEENRDRQINVIVNKSDSPIKLMSGFVSRIEDYSRINVNRVD